MATQYEWVDVYSLKRWGDPSTMGSIGGGSSWNPGSNQGFQWNTEIDFSEKNGFFNYYAENNSSSTRRVDAITNPSIILLKSYYYSYYSGGNSINYNKFVMCEEFDKFSNLSENNLKYIQGTFTASYEKWAIYFVLEDGSILAIDRYPDTVSDVQLRLPVHKIIDTDKRFLGRFLIYNLYTGNGLFYDPYSNPSPTSITGKHGKTPNSIHPLHNDTWGEAYVKVKNLKFLNK